MPNEKLVISYRQFENVEFSGSRAMARYLEDEGKTWAAFLDEIKAETQFVIASSPRSFSAEQIARSFSLLSDRLDDAKSFNNASLGHNRPTLLPPPSTSLTGQLILGLHLNRRLEAAFAVFAYYCMNENTGQNSATPSMKSLYAQGEKYFIGAVSAEALPAHKLNGSKLATATKAANAQAEAMREQVDEAIDINSQQEGALKDFVGARETAIERLLNEWAESEINHEEHFSSWLTASQERVDAAFRDAEARLMIVDRDAKKDQVDRQEQHDALIDLFQTQLQFKAPAKLWNDRANAHNNTSKVAFRMFGFGIAATILFAISVPLLGGNFIAASFFEFQCNYPDPRACERVFSAKGPLMVSGFLLVSSLLLWATRLQYKVYLSERHLSLDASEKKAFSETYLALRETSAVGDANEAIVLASLFRPTQDGIIKDDDSGFDMSAASAISRQFTRGSS